jgi:hypothetical protein
MTQIQTLIGSSPLPVQITADATHLAMRYYTAIECAQ